MKRIFSIALLSIFIFSTVGVIASPYCCKVKEMKSHMCCHKSCCKHEVKLLQVKDDFVSSVSQDPPKNFSSSLAVAIPTAIKKYFAFSYILFSEDQAPPGKTIDRLSFIQSFLI